jgi:hypothetical protein
MSIEVERNSESRRGGFAYERPAGTKIAAPLEICVVPLVLCIQNAAASASGYDLLLDQPVNYVREIRLVAVAGTSGITRKVLLTADDGSNLFDAVRAATDSTRFSGQLIVSPGIALAEPLVLKTWRDATGVLPRRVNLIQRNVDNTAFTGDSTLTLYFNIVCTRFQ